MKAAEYERYGDSSVLEVRDAPAPAAGRGQVLVRVHAAALNPKDVLVRKGKYRIFSGRRFPQRVGYDWAGEVLDANGQRGFDPGQKLFGMINAWSAGACAEMVAVRVDECAPIPLGLTFEQAASLPLAGLTALQSLRDLGRIRSGDAALINGASGGVGTLAIQIAKALGARVTSLSSAANLELCRGLGSEEALDYAADRPLDRPGAFRCIFDVFGNLSFDKTRLALGVGGTYVSTVPSLRLALDLAKTLFSSIRARVVLVRSNRPDLEQLAQWVAAVALKPVVDRVWPLDQIREAHDYIATKRARGKVVLTVT